MIQCRLCGKKAGEVSLLQRVNEKGVEGIWECRPSCDESLPQAEALIAAVEGQYEEKELD